MAHHWHECYRLSHRPDPGEPTPPARLPWSELDTFVRRDNILQIRSIMTAVAGCGRRWVPERSVRTGELHRADRPGAGAHKPVRAHAVVPAAARGRLVSGRTTPPHPGRPAPARPDQQPRGAVAGAAQRRAPAADRATLRSQLAQLEDVGFVPVVPAGGPPAGRPSSSASAPSRPRSCTPAVRGPGGPAISSTAIRVTGGSAMIPVTCAPSATSEFRASHAPIDGEHWRRIGAYRAWRVNEAPGAADDGGPGGGPGRGLGGRRTRRGTLAGDRRAVPPDLPPLQREVLASPVTATLVRACTWRRES